MQPVVKSCHRHSGLLAVSSFVVRIAGKTTGADRVHSLVVVGKRGNILA